LAAGPESGYLRYNDHQQMEQGIMALWDKPESGATPAAPAAGGAPRPAGPAPAPSLYTQDSASALKERTDMKESIISAGLFIEGKITGNGHVRVAGKFKGDIQVDGNLHIDSGARVEGQVRAGEVIVSGELLGNIESARRVELQQGGTITGDVKAGSLTVAAGSRMRGAVDFGFDEAAKAGASPAASLLGSRSNVA
jgi:cytoskeletal protein CcmA (bactofilin family)